MVLLADLGNTNVKFRAADKERLLGERSCAAPTREPEAWLGAARKALADAGATAARLVAASVVPGRVADLRCVAGLLGLDCLLVPRELPLDIENRYARPDEVGADRLAVAFAARRTCDAERIIVLDFGTATTFDCVRGGAYLGGLICPGVRSSIRSFTEDTAQLPSPSLEVDPTGLRIGVSTMDSLNQGVVYGFAAMVEGLVARLERPLGGPARVLATGGYAEIIAPVCPAIHEVRGDLVLEGLRLAAYDRA
ncbi:type III pantothenate kinase [Paucidesulfovibrio longus]|uniref:type III pantothenate kinase n=1 Tax=Paucidesulfovibrio longus TaxID=889 RepID=UPI0003B7501B|nr:type III pantothenate kinase [Paucidesulfovibrio longus]